MMSHGDDFNRVMLEAIAQPTSCTRLFKQLVVEKQLSSSSDGEDEAMTNGEYDELVSPRPPPPSPIRRTPATRTRLTTSPYFDGRKACEASNRSQSAWAKLSSLPILHTRASPTGDMEVSRAVEVVNASLETTVEMRGACGGSRSSLSSSSLVPSTPPSSLASASGSDVAGASVLHIEWATCLEEFIKGKPVTESATCIEEFIKGKPVTESLLPSNAAVVSFDTVISRVGVCTMLPLHPILTPHSHLPAPEPPLICSQETTGRAGDVIQLAYVIFDKEGVECANRMRYLRMARGAYIESGAFNVHHINKATLEMHGIDTRRELERFVALVECAQARQIRVVAHSAAFDVNAINRTLIKFKSPERVQMAHTFCTMNAARPLMKLQNVRGRVKNPKNSEMYTFLVKEELPLKLHDALVDCRMTGRAFIAGARRRWWRF